MQARPVGGRDNSLSFKKLMKAPRIGGKRKNRPAVFFKVDLRKHFPPCGLIANPENELVAPSGRFADGFNHIRQRQEKCSRTFGIHAFQYGISREREAEIERCVKVRRSRFR